MLEYNIENSVTFYELQWDTDFFGVSSAKAVLSKPLVLDEWDILQKKIKKYQFISIENRNSEPSNSKFIGMNTNAFLIDVNIQFNKKLCMYYDNPINIEIYNALERNNQILDLAEFQYSKFTEDSELAKRGGNQVYRQWIINSFGKQDKYFALSRNKDKQINGFLLYSYREKFCYVELIAVSNKVKHEGIGSSLFRATEKEACERGFDEIRVGTQVRNNGAINFYQKVGCKQIGCHQIYHMWNL